MSLEKEFLQDDGQLRVFIVPVDILDVPDLTTHEKMVYIVLRSYVNPTDPTAFPSYSTIAEKASMSRRHAMRCVESLIEKGLIRKEMRLTVTKGRKIKNSSNLYTLITPKSRIHSKRKDEKLTDKKVKGGDSQSLPPVTHSHQGGDSQSPYHNHLTEPFRTMIDCMGASAEIASAAESSIHDEIFDALKKHVPKNCYILNNVPMGNEYINDIYLMLINQFPNQLSAEVVKIACERYFEKACRIQSPEGVVMQLDIKNPVGFFKTCYKEAIQQYKANRRHQVNKSISDYDREWWMQVTREIDGNQLGTHV